MKKTLTFIPLGIGISATIIYIFNIIQFRVINNSASLFQILSNLKIYLYIAIAGFVSYFLIMFLTLLERKNKSKNINETENKELIIEDAYEPLEETSNYSIEDIKKDNVYMPNYDYVPMYQEEQKKIIEEPIKKVTKEVVLESDDINKVVINGNKYCFNCGEKIYDTDNFCSHCGKYQSNDKKHINPILKNIINVLEIVILFLIIYFLLNMLFDYKESIDPSFKSPFKVSMTK